MEQSTDEQIAIIHDTLRELDQVDLVTEISRLRGLLYQSVNCISFGKKIGKCDGCSFFSKKTCLVDKTKIPDQLPIQIIP